MTRVIFATGNPGKAREVKDIFKGLDIEIISLLELEDVPEIIEDADTYEGNAKIKAKVIYDKFQMPVISDDSGLSVDQLEGRPGVHSARYAGENCTYADNNRKLLKELENFHEPHQAQFICCAVYYDGNEYTSVFGKLNGKILSEPRGENGFGYDPVFVPDDLNGKYTLAELDLDKKNQISHRFRAFKQLKEKLNGLLS